MKVRIGRIARWGFSAAIVALLIVFAFRVNWHQAWDALRNASPLPLLTAALINLLSLVFKGVRWWVFLRPVGVRSLGLALRATFAGAGLNNVLVAQGGEAARVVFVSRATSASSASVFAALTMERLFEFIGYFLLLVGAAFIPDVPQSIARWRTAALIALVAMLGLLVYLVRASKTARPAGQEAIVAAPTGWVARSRSYASRFFRSMADVATPGRFAAALGLSLLVWACQVATYHLTARAAHLHLTLAGSVAAVLACNIGFLIRATPGNVGVFQFIYALTVKSFGVDEDQAVAVAFLIQTLQVIPVTLLAVGLAPEFVFRRRRHRIDAPAPPM